MNSKKIIQLSTTQKIMLSFLCAILVGSFLLALPISSATGEAVPYIDALFTATTSICVTGLVTVPTDGSHIFHLERLGTDRDPVSDPVGRSGSHYGHVRCDDGTAQTTGTG